MKLKKIYLPFAVLSVAALLASCGGTQQSSSSSQAPSVEESSSVATSEEEKQSSGEAITSEEATSQEEQSKTEASQTFTVTFNSKGGSAVRKQTIEEGEKATRPTDPSKSGYIFIDWYTEDTFENVFDFDTPITADITLYAKWELNLDRVLTSSLAPNVVNVGDDSFALFTDSYGLKMHNKDGGWSAAGNSFKMGWRTIMVVDAEGRLCFSVWCPDNGYGGPKDYSYVCDEYYGPNGVGYENNPAFIIGATYNRNSADFELVVPEGGFAITGYEVGATNISAMVTAGAINLYDGLEDDAPKRVYNATHGEWSSRRYFFNAQTQMIEVYDLASYINYTGAKSGVFVNDNVEKKATLSIGLVAGNGIALNLFDGLNMPLGPSSGVTFEGQFTKTLGGDGDSKMYFKDGDNSIYAGSNGTYSFEYDFAAKKMTISFEEEVEVDPTATLNCVINEVSDTYPTIYDGNATNIEIGASNYTLGFDANGKMIYGSYGPGNGYGGPSDGFYHDGSYELVAGEVCGIFDVDSEFAPWPNKTTDERNAWTLYDVVVPEGGYLITGTADQIRPLVLEMTGFDINQYANNALFESTLAKGAYNGYSIGVVEKTHFAQVRLQEVKYFISLVDVLGTLESDTLVVSSGQSFTLPTPTNAPSGYTFSRWVDANGETVTDGVFNGDSDISYFAAYIKGGEEVIYTGKAEIKSTVADSEFSVVTDTNFIAHSTEGWQIGTGWNMSWRTFAIIDAEGRVAYAVHLPANGYGGPKAYSYHHDPYYGVNGVGYEGNPAITILDDFDDWPNTTASGKNAWDQFILSIPEGGFLISTHSNGADELGRMISSGAITSMTNQEANFNKAHDWSNRFSQDGNFVYTQLVLPL